METVKPDLRHCKTLLGTWGIIQFSHGDLPDLDSGTCLDDNVRALLVADGVLAMNPKDKIAQQMGERALRFIEAARIRPGSFHNFMDNEGRFTDEFGSPESVGRTIWALGVTARCATVPAWRARACEMLSDTLDCVGCLSSLHSRAFAIIGLSAAVDPNAAPLPVTITGTPCPAEIQRRIESALHGLCAGLHFEFGRNADTEWAWWEPILTYDNAKIPEAMFRGALALDYAPFADTALLAATFLRDITQPQRMFVAIGNDGWYPRGGRRALYDQQPLEAAAMVDMWIAMHRYYGKAAFLQHAEDAYQWFFGRNTGGISLVDEVTGACHDALLPDGKRNGNMGAESTLALLQAQLFLNAAKSQTLAA